MLRVGSSFMKLFIKREVVAENNIFLRKLGIESQLSSRAQNCGVACDTSEYLMQLENRTDSTSSM